MLLNITQVWKCFNSFILSGLIGYHLKSSCLYLLWVYNQDRVWNIYLVRKVLVTQLCLTLCNPLDCNHPVSVHGILQARILEWIAILFSGAFSRPRGWTWAFCIAGRFFTVWTTRESFIKEPDSKCFQFYLFIGLVATSEPSFGHRQCQWIDMTPYLWSFIYKIWWSDLVMGPVCWLLH